jgi:hypothetical protein
MRNTIISAVVLSLSLTLTINAQPLNWNLVVSSSQNCIGCTNEALTSNQLYVDKVVKTLQLYVTNASDSTVCESFISYFQNPHAYDPRHEQATTLIEMSKTDKTGKIDLFITSLYANSDIGSDIQVATRTTPTIPAYTKSNELNKMIAQAYNLLPRNKKESQRHYDARIRDYATSSYLTFVRHTTQNGGSLPATETAFASELAKKYNKYN